jgi:hypothetical protein
LQRSGEPTFPSAQAMNIFAGRALFDDVSLQVNRDDRIGV